MASNPVSEMLSRNSDFVKDHQPPPHMQDFAPINRASGKGVTLISCSDPRVPCEKILGFDEEISPGKINPIVIRNAGGRVSDAIRTIGIMQAIAAPGYIAVMHHTDCGMIHYPDKVVRKTLQQISPSEKAQFESMEFGEINGSIEGSVKDDIAFLSKSPFIKQGTQLVGLVYDVDTGKVTIVE